MMYALLLLLMTCCVGFSHPVDDKTPRLARAALDDFRVRQFFDTHTVSSLSLEETLPKDDEIVDDEMSSLRDVDKHWDDAFNIDSRFPPFKAKKVETGEEPRRTKRKPPKIIQRIDVEASKKSKAEPQLSPAQAVITDFVVDSTPPEFVRRPKRDGIRNFSFPFAQEEPPPVDNRYSSVTSRILNDYLNETAQ